jgi:hypothetical protein
VKRVNKELRARQFARAFQFTADKLSLTESEAMEIADLFEPWAAGKAYAIGKKIKYGVNADGETQLYEVLQAHTSAVEWKPDTVPALYKAVGFSDSGVPVWTQPIGAGDAYRSGDIVEHNGKRWTSTVNNNVWSPGVYGWAEV